MYVSADQQWVETASTDGYYVDAVGPDFDNPDYDKATGMPEGTFFKSNAVIFTDAAGPPAWRNVASTAIVCTEDRAISVDRLEQMADRTGGAIVRWASSHSPFLSRPDEVATLLADIASSQ